MNIRDIIPVGVKDYIRLVRLKRTFPRAQIHSPLVSEKAEVGMDCLLSRDVEVSSGVAIGDYSYVNAGTIIASGKVGRFCSIGYYCQIGMPEHPIGYLSTSPRTYAERNVFGLPQFWDSYTDPPVIGSDVWIGSQAIVLQGVTIGSGAIIAAGAVVTKDVEPYAIVGGTPAKLIRYRFEAPTIERLLRLEWWNLPLDELKQLKDTFALKDAAWNALDAHD